MQNCTLPMGILASRDYIIQTYGNTDMPLHIAYHFEEIAKKNGSSAELCIYTSEMTLEVEEVGGVRGWRALQAKHLNREETKYHQWLREAHDIASST